jgi:pantothenate kinase-related protein Tda10
MRTTEDPHRQSSVTIVEDGSGSEYEEDPDEDAYIQRAAHEQASQAPAAGSVREAGSISKVILVQFMCHAYQVVELGPQINFVIGHNGSGKSAVLTAITLVLGAKATSTVSQYTS